MLNLELKTRLLKSCIENAQTWNRTTAIVNEFRTLVYDENGNWNGESGKEIYDFIVKVESEMSKLEHRPVDYSPILNLILESEGEKQ